MNLGLDLELQEELAEGVIHLSADGQVTDFNRAAVPWIKYAMVARNQLRHQMEQIASGELKAPLPIQLPDTADPVLHEYPVYLCTTGPVGYALFIANRRAALQAATPAANDNDFFRLMGSQTRHELTHLRDSLSSASNDTGIARAGLHEQSDRVSQLLVALDQLSRLYQSEALRAGERMSLWRLVKQLVDETPRSQCDFHITPAIESKAESDSVIYGDATWLEISLRALMAAVAQSAPAHSQVEMRVRLNGGYIVLSSHFSNGSIRQTPRCKESLPPVKSALRFDSDIGRQICHRVVEMHGGLLTITETDRKIEGVPGVESFVATFPLSAPSRAERSNACDKCPTALQMEKYAKDIAFLLTRQPAIARTTAQEIQMLTKLLSVGESREVPP